MVNSCIRLVRAAPNPFSSKFMPSKHFIRIKNDSLEFHFAFFLFSLLSSYQKFFSSHFAFQESGAEEEASYAGNSFQTGGLLELLKRLLMSKTHVP